MLHPAAWWAWGLALAAIASRTTNPFLLVLIIAVVGWVVAERRELGTVNAFWPFLVIGLFAVGLRVLMVGLLGDGVPGRVVLIRLPQVPLPSWSNGVRIGGPVTAEGLLAAAYDGVRMAAVLVCLGAANALASPRRLLRYLPATLYEAGTAVVVALTFAPQLVDDARRVLAARRLRGHSSRRITDVPRVAVPVLVGALARSLELAASMESRGYGRMVHRTPASTRAAGLLTLVGLGGVVVGLYGMLDATTPTLLGAPMLALGLVCALGALVVGVRHDARTHYRRDRWRLAETGVALAGVVPVTVFAWAGAHAWPGLVPAQVPLAVPPVSVTLVLAVLAAGLAGVVAPVPPLLAQSRLRPPVPAEVTP